MNSFTKNDLMKMDRGCQSGSCQHSHTKLAHMRDPGIFKYVAKTDKVLCLNCYKKK